MIKNSRTILGFDYPEIIWSTVEQWAHTEGFRLKSSGANGGICQKGTRLTAYSDYAEDYSG